MSLSIGIVGLPNVGKSTLFNALLKKQIADVSNYPFCTIRPNQGVVEVPDERLDRLASSLNLSKKIPAVVKFIDIAGLVKGAYKGEGLGNQFLAHIRQCDALIEVVRFFGDKEITGVVDPESDIEVIKTELTLKDLETVKKYLDKVKKETKTGDKKTQEEIKLLEKIQGFLDQDKMISEMDLSDDEKEELIKSLCLLTAKPILLIANVSERSLRKRYKELESKGFVPVSAKLEAELTELSNKEAQQYLEELGLKELGLNRLIKKAYNLLDLIAFYTLIPDEQIQAWPILKQTKVPDAGGIIHSDFENKFIAAEVIDRQDLVEIGSWQRAKEEGKIRTEGKDYIVCDGDVVHFKI